MTEKIAEPQILLSHEELAYVLWALRTPTMLGMPDGPFDGLNAEQASLLMNSAERTLLARTLIEIDAKENTLVLEPLLVAFVGPCANSDVSAILTRNQSGQPGETHFFHSADKIYVEHTIQANALHRFHIYYTLEKFQDRIFELLIDKKKVESFEGSSIIMSEAQLNKIRELNIEDKTQEILTEIRNTDSDAEAQEMLYQDFTEYACNSSLAFIESNKAQQEAQEVSGLGILQGQERLWMIENIIEDQQERWVQFRPGSFDEIKIEIQKHFTEIE